MNVSMAQLQEALRTLPAEHHRKMLALNGELNACAREISSADAAVAAVAKVKSGRLACCGDLQHDSLAAWELNGKTIQLGEQQVISKQSLASHIQASLPDVLIWSLPPPPPPPPTAISSVCGSLTLLLHRCNMPRHVLQSQVC